MDGLPTGFLWGRRITAGIGLVGGVALTAFVLAAMNGAISAPDRSRGDDAVTFDVPTPPKPPPSRPKPRPKPKPRKTSAPPPPIPALSAGLAGLSFGLPGLDGALDDATQALVGDVGDVVMNEDSVDSAPRPTYRVPPDYPPRARADDVTGYVTLSLLVGADGELQDLRVLESEPAGVFDEAAKAAMRQWRFDPATYEGRPVSVRVRQTLRFELE